MSGVRTVKDKKIRSSAGVNISFGVAMGIGYYPAKKDVYILILDNGQEVEVDKVTYDSYNIGDSYKG